MGGIEQEVRETDAMIDSALEHDCMLQCQIDITRMFVCNIHVLLVLLMFFFSKRRQKSI
jgi:hypothetical protein